MTPFLRTYILAADFDSDGHPTRPNPVLEFAPDTEVSQILTRWDRWIWMAGTWKQVRWIKVKGRKRFLFWWGKDGFVWDKRLERDICQDFNGRNLHSGLNYGTLVSTGWGLELLVLFYWILGEVILVCWSTAWSFALSTFELVSHHKEDVVMVFGAQ